MESACKRCLLLEAGERQSYKTVSDYIASLDAQLKVSDRVYNSRLEQCRQCSFLISGMCLKCGCYAEVRAVLKAKSCANADDRKWNRED